MSTPDRRIGGYVIKASDQKSLRQSRIKDDRMSVVGASDNKNVKCVVICPKQLLIIHSGLDQEGPFETSEEKLVRLRTTQCT